MTLASQTIRPKAIRPKGLTQRLAILFGLLVLLLLGVAAAYIDFSWHVVKREKLADLRNLVELGAVSSEMFLQRYSERASILAEDVTLHGGAQHPAALRARLLRHQAADPNLAGVYAFRADGSLIASTTEETAPAPAHRVLVIDGSLSMICAKRRRNSGSSSTMTIEMGPSLIAVPYDIGQRR